MTREAEEPCVQNYDVTKIGDPCRNTRRTALLNRPAPGAEAVGEQALAQIRIEPDTVHGLQHLIVRPSNPYGANSFSRQSQGVIDVFLEKILAGQPLSIWGNVDTVRDYIFIDDLIEAFIRLTEVDDAASRIVNLGSGHGASLFDVVQSIGRVTQRQPEWSVDPEKYAGVSSCVLDISRLKELTGWKPNYALDQGIEEAWRRKRDYRRRRAVA